MSVRLAACDPADVHTIQRAIVNHVEYTLASNRFEFDNKKAYRATAHRCGAAAAAERRSPRVQTMRHASRGQGHSERSRS